MKATVISWSLSNGMGETSPPTLVGSRSRITSRNYLARCVPDPAVVCFVVWARNSLRHLADSWVSRRKRPLLPTTFPWLYGIWCSHSAMPSAARHCKVSESDPGVPRLVPVGAQSKAVHLYPVYTPGKLVRSPKPELAVNRVPAVIGPCVQRKALDSNAPLPPGDCREESASHHGQQAHR